MEFTASYGILRGEAVSFDPSLLALGLASES